RNRNSVRTQLKKGDRVWLEPKAAGQKITSGHDVTSIPGARGGRIGVRFLEILKKKCEHMVPDSLREDGLVDVTSDLFGNVPMTEGKGYEAFAARVRPENLVFSSPKTFWNQMPPMGVPHPGCKAFYATNDDYDAISLEDMPRGYKVYRTSSDVGDKAPWLYRNQPIFDKASPKPFASAGKMTRECELLQDGMSGKLRISYRSLSRGEFALMLLILSCDLRLGGGKPLGLGHAVVTSVKAYDETGAETLSWAPSERASLPEAYTDLVSDTVKRRAKLYCQTQVPVEMMRYPRAMSSNGNQRGGMCWFGTFASNKKNSTTGLQTVQARLPGMASEQQVRAQGLPRFDMNDLNGDLLYGYDVHTIVEEARKQTNVIIGIEDANKASSHGGNRYDNESQNRESRKDNRKNNR
ncbi:MAG: hypothetical protein IJS15_07635, partial [Victivallales bacterium]|nr:hypothetical protein [Victivallales bacterium]